MATVASSVNMVSLPGMSGGGLDSASKTTPKRLNLGYSAGVQKVTQPLYTPEHGSNNYIAFTNWQSYNMNGNINMSSNSTNPMPSPPVTDSTASLRSSTTSSPSESVNETNSPATSSYFNPFKRRSRSMAIPAPTSCCPNCGLRRPSIISDQVVSSSHLPPSPTFQLPPKHRPHLPIHLHCHNACPDDIFPTNSATTQNTESPYHKRHHHRRRSSLCYAESLVGDANDLDSGAIPTDIKQGWERQAEVIARKVVERESRNGSPDNDRIEEEDVAVISE